MALTKVQIDGVEFSDSTDLNVDNGTLVVDSTNNRVGVGTTSPGHPLTIQSDASNSFAIQANSDTTLKLMLGYSYTNDYARIAAEDAGVNQKDIFQNALNHRWGRNHSTEYMRLDSSGRVGIGTTSPGSYGNNADDLIVANTGGHAGLTIHSASNGTGNLFFADGTTGDQAYRGILKYDHSNDRFLFGTAGGTTALTIDSSQRVGIGTTSPTAALNVNTGATDLTADFVGTGSPYIRIDNGTKKYIAQVTGSDFRIQDQSASAERLRIDSSGRLLVGTSSSVGAGSGQYAKLQVGPSTFGSTSGGKISIQRGQAASAISSGSEIGQLVFSDNAGGDYAFITVRSDAAGGSSDYPGRIEFSTTADGASSPTERLRIANNGAWGLGGATYGSSGQVLTSQGSGSAPQWATPAAGSSWTWDTSQTTLAGNTSVTVTGIPSTATKILVHFYNVSNNTNEDWIFRLGNSSGIVTSGYHVSAGYMFSGNSSRSNGFHTYATGTASHKWTGFIECVNIGSTLWYCQMFFNAESDANTHFAVGKVGVSTLDRINFSTYSGTFDDGGIYVSYMEP